MDFLTLLKNVLALVETAALIGALVMSAKGFREHKNKEARKALLTKACMFLAVYMALNILRINYFQM